jgi:hypothetical protein
MSFNAWLRQRQIPDSDRLFALIQAAGSAGIPEKELRGSVELSRRLVDDLLAALVGSRVVRVAENGGKRLFFCR